MTMLQDVLRAFVDRRLDDWAGLPAHASIHEARKALGLPVESEGRAHLGMPGASADRQSLDDRPLVVFFRGSELVLLDYEGPFTDVDLMQMWGEPPHKLNAAWGVATMPHGEWVYPDRGLAAIVSSSGQTLRLFGFAPTSLDHYERMVRRNLGTRPRPSQPLDDGGGAFR